MLPCINITISSNSPYLVSNSTRIRAHLLSILVSQYSSSIINFPILFPITSKRFCRQKTIGKPNRISHICCKLCGSLLALKSTFHFFGISPDGPWFQFWLRKRELSSSFLILKRNHLRERIWNSGV